MAGRASDPPLDEIQWSSPTLVQQMQGIHTNSVLPYFANSPFCDQTSNNAVLISQAMYNPNMLPIVATREAFEGRLKTMSGLEYIVAQEPDETAPGTGTGVWVIRKQTRKKRPGQEDELTVHSTYFVVGDNIYTAPSVGHVIGSRLLSIFTSLNKFISIASDLPNFTPALGHTYMPPQRANRPKASESQTAQVSKENTPMPDSLQSAKKATSSSPTTSAYLASRLLAESLDLTFRYGEEYMDENPITGHPGDFHFSTTGRKGNALKIPPGVIKGLPQNQTQSQASKTSTETPTPEAAKGPTIELPPVRKGSKTGDKSPKTPGAPKPKRRKSKALSSAGGVSPTT